MPLTLRRATTADLDDCARIAFEAFGGIAEAHGYPRDIPVIEVAEVFVSALLQHPGFYSVIAEQQVRVVGCGFMDERSSIGGIGPVVVDCDAQSAGIGRAMMNDLLLRGEERGLAGLRLVQAGYNTRSLGLYARVGFDVREYMATMQGAPIRQEFPGYTVRPARHDDLSDCAALCARVHGHHRTPEMEDAITRGSASLVEYDGRIAGYTTAVAFFGHTVAETNVALMALIAAAPEYAGPGFLLPVRNGDVFRWCLANGLRIVHTTTLMSRGLYNEPRGAFLPSILY